MKSLILAALLASTSALAGIETLGVHSVVNLDPATSMVKFKNGRVGFWKNNPADVSTLTNQFVEVDLSDKNEILSFKKVPAPEMVEVPNIRKSLNLNLDYTPTTFSNYSKAEEAQNSFRKGFTEKAQCYDKAHVWAYEENTRYGGRLMKAFLFFSDTYIARYNYKWWFHAAPYSHVRMNGMIQERVMDATFSRSPLQFRIWTDIFMKNKAECQVITKYTDYSTRPGEADCYLMKVNMYFWQPKDLESFELTGVQKTKFIEWEITHSFKEAFGMENY